MFDFAQMRLFWYGQRILCWSDVIEKVYEYADRVSEFKLFISVNF